MNAMNEEKLAYLLGAIYGDGCFTKGSISFGVADKEFIDEIINIIKNLFGLEINIGLKKLSDKNPKWRDFYQFHSRRLFKFISRFDLKKLKTIPDFILRGDNNTKASFIKGFFDAEGNVDVRVIKRKDGRTDTMRHVKCFSNDTKLLQQIKQLLSQLQIKSEIFRGKKENYYVCIWNYRSLKKFNDLIGFVINRKKEVLVQAINSYKQIQTQWNFNTYKTVMDIRDKEKFGAKRIKQKLLGTGINVPQPTIEAWIYGRSKISENKMEV